MQKLKSYLQALAVTVFFLLPSFTPAAPVSSSASAKMGKFIGAVETVYPSWFLESFLDIREDIADAGKAGKHLMILFTQDGCPYCNALVERNFAQKDIEELVRGKFEVVAMNIVGDREVTDVDGKRYTEKTFASKLNVQFTPTLLFFNSKNEIILRLNGYLPPEQFKVALDYIVEKEGQLSFRDFVELNAPAPKAGKLNQEPFFIKPPYNLSRKAGGKARPVAVFFEQKDCPNCDALHRNILADAEIRHLLARYDAVQLDMWDKTTSLTTPQGKTGSARDWAKELDVKYAPTIILFDGEGREILREEAMFKLFHTQSFFDYVQSGAYRQQPSFQRYISHRAEQLRAQGRDVDIWRMGDAAAMPKK